MLYLQSIANGFVALASPSLLAGMLLVALVSAVVGIFIDSEQARRQVDESTISFLLFKFLCSMFVIFFLLWWLGECMPTIIGHRELAAPGLAALIAGSGLQVLCFFVALILFWVAFSWWRILVKRTEYHLLVIGCVCVDCYGADLMGSFEMLDNSRSIWFYLPLVLYGILMIASLFIQASLMGAFKAGSELGLGELEAICRRGTFRQQLRLVFSTTLGHFWVLFLFLLYAQHSGSYLNLTS